MIFFTIYDLFTKIFYDGDGRKTPKYTKDETKENIPSLVATPISRLQSEGRPIFWCPKNTEIKPRSTLSERGFLI